MNNTDKQFKELVGKILETGHKKSDRTGTGTISIFGHQMSLDMSDGFPLLTLRKIHTKSIIHELLWFLGSYDQEKYGKFGNTNIRYLLDNGVTFWTEWPYQNYLKCKKYRDLPDFTMKEFEMKILLDDDFALEFGSIGKGYGYQWTNMGGNVEKIINSKGGVSFNVTQGINQIDNCIEDLKKNPDSRRIIVNSWNPMDLKEMLLPPCHMIFQFNTYKMTPTERLFEFKKKNLSGTVEENAFPERRISLHMYQRSVDLALGQPFNVSEYSLLLHMMGQVVNMIPDKFIWTGGDVHIYNNHVEQMKEILDRESYNLPTLRLNENIKNIYDFRYGDIVIENYKSNPNIKMEVSV